MITPLWQHTVHLRLQIVDKRWADAYRSADKMEAELIVQGGEIAERRPVVVPISQGKKRVH